MRFTDGSMFTFNFEPRIELPALHGRLAGFVAAEIRCFFYELFGRDCPICKEGRSGKP